MPYPNRLSLLGWGWGGTMVVFVCLFISHTIATNSPRSSSHSFHKLPEKILAIISLPKKSPKSWISNPQKIFCTSPSIEIWSAPPPGGTSHAKTVLTYLPITSHMETTEEPWYGQVPRYWENSLATKSLSKDCTMSTNGYLHQKLPHTKKMPKWFRMGWSDHKRRIPDWMCWHQSFFFLNNVPFTVR